MPPYDMNDSDWFSSEPVPMPKPTPVKAQDDEDYRPSDAEEFMNERQQDYFRGLLLAWKKSILSESESTLAHLQDGPLREPDRAVPSPPPCRPVLLRRLPRCQPAQRARLPGGVRRSGSGSRSDAIPNCVDRIPHSAFRVPHLLGAGAD